MNKLADHLASLPDDQATLQIAKILKEPKIYLVRTIIKVTPRAVVIDVMTQTIEQMQLGASKSAGGVFITLLKSHN